MKDAFYFPHFSNARSDRKIKRLRKELGIEGYGIYFMLLETLRDQTNFKYPIDDIDLLADEFGTSEQKVRTVITNYKLFLVDKNEFFYSTKLISFMKPYLNMKEQRRQAGIKSGLARRKKAKTKELPFNGSSTGVQRELNENEQRKVKENKLKESKNNIYVPLAEKMKAFIFQLSPNSKITESQVQKWSNTFRLMVEQDKRTFEQIDCLIFDLYTKPEYSFWSKNILSADTLRKRLNEGKLDNLKPNQSNTNQPYQYGENWIEKGVEILKSKEVKF